MVGRQPMSDMQNRYARQIILPEVGANGQQKLRDAHVLVVGAGGLGVPVLQYLVGAGVGKITIVDPDVVSLSNLHRQTLYGEQYIDQPKAEVAAKILRDLNADIEIIPIESPLNPANVARLLRDATIALDCADNFAVSYVMSDHCLAHNIPLISASALALSGYVGGFCAGAPSLRALFPSLPDQAGSCATAGVLGPVVGTIGSLQAQMALSHLLKLNPSPLGLLIRFDAKTFRFSNFRFDNAKEPSSSILNFIAPSDLKQNDYVIELRDSDEVEHPIVESAMRINVADYNPENGLPNNDQRAVFVCRSGLRAHKAALKLQKKWNGDIALVAAG